MIIYYGRLIIILEIFNDVRTLHKFDISDNPGLSKTDLNATIRAVCQSPELSVLRLSNLNISHLTHMLDPLLDTGK